MRVGDLVFLAGQIPINPRAGQVNLGTIEEHSAQVLDELKAVLAAAGLSMENVGSKKRQAMSPGVLFSLRAV